MILEASAIHTAYPEYLRRASGTGYSTTVTVRERDLRDMKGEREEMLDKGPAIILASGGMMNGGASLEYFKGWQTTRRTPSIRGIQQLNSLGRRIQNGSKEIVLPGRGRQAGSDKGEPQIKTVEGFSGHSDRRQLIELRENLRPRPRTIFTMHGEEPKCEDLARALGR